MSSKTFKITYRQIGPDRWQEYHDGNPVGVITQIPYFAKPVDSEKEAEERQLRREEAARNAFLKRTEDPQFAKVRDRMIEKAGGDEELVGELDSNYQSFNRAYDSVRRDGLEERHRARMEAIREKQHSINGMERGQADIDAQEEMERHREAISKIEAGEYAGVDEQEEGSR